MADINGNFEHSAQRDGTRLLTEEHTPTINGAGSNGHEPGALYWQRLQEERDGKIVWLHPPVPARKQHDNKIQSLLNGLADLLRDSHPYRAWLLQWNYHARAAAAQEEMEDVVREAHHAFAEHTETAEDGVTGATDGDASAGARLQALQATQATLEEALTTTRRNFAQAAAQAGLLYDVGAVTDSAETDHSHHTQPRHTMFGIPFLKARAKEKEETTDDQPAPAPTNRPVSINPHLVERALRDSAPSLEDMAGQHGMAPAPEAKQYGFLERIFITLAPLVSGFMLALCLGTLVGLVDMRVLRSAQVRFMDFVPFIGALLLGSVLVFLMGELVSTAIHSLANALEMRDSHGKSSIEDSCPRLHGELAMALLFLGSVLLLAIAEITAEAIGLRTLHLERIRTLNLTGTRETTLSLWIYFIIGLLISGPYLLYKASKAWSESQSRLREAWLVHKQLRWLQDRRQDAKVQEAFRLAYRVEQLEAKLSSIRKRLDEARAAAVGEAARLHQMVEQIVTEQEALNPHPNGTRPGTRFNRNPVRFGNR